MSDESIDDKQAGTPASQYAPDIPTANVENGIETFNNRLLTTKKLLIERVLTELGYPLITVELTPEQFDCCISNACHLYTKYATFQERYLCLDFKDYDEVKGLNIKKFNISRVKDISFVPYELFGTSTSELCFGLPGFISGQGLAMWHNFDFISMQCAYEFRELAERMLFPKPDWTYNNVTGYLIMYPSPKTLMMGGTGKYMVGSGDCRYNVNRAVATVEIEPTLEELYSNECVKSVVVGYAKMMLGTIRSKFTGVNLPGGAQVTGETLRIEGQAIIDKAIETIRANESYGNHFLIV